MCDFSLEMVKSRKAVEGDILTIRQFPSGSKGFVAQGGDPDCAVCLEEGAKLILHSDTDNGITVSFERKQAFYFTYRDGYTTEDGAFQTLQILPVGTVATVVKPLPEVLTEAVEAPAAFDPDEKPAEVKELEALLR